MNEIRQGQRMSLIPEAQGHQEGNGKSEYGKKIRRVEISGNRAHSIV